MTDWKAEDDAKKEKLNEMIRFIDEELEPHIMDESDTIRRCGLLIRNLERFRDEEL